MTCQTNRLVIVWEGFYSGIVGSLVELNSLVWVSILRENLDVSVTVRSDMFMSQSKSVHDHVRDLPVSILKTTVIQGNLGFRISSQISRATSAWFSLDKVHVGFSWISVKLTRVKSKASSHSNVIEKSFDSVDFSSGETWLNFVWNKLVPVRWVAGYSSRGTNILSKAIAILNPTRCVVQFDISDGNLAKTTINSCLENNLGSSTLADLTSVETPLIPHLNVAAIVRPENVFTRSLGYFSKAQTAVTCESVTE